MFIFQCCGSSQELWTKCLLTLGLYKHRLKGWSCSRKLSLFGKLTSELMLFYLNWVSKIYSECLFFHLGAYLSLSLCVLCLATPLSPLCTVAFLVWLPHFHFQVCAPKASQSCLIVTWDSVNNFKKGRKCFFPPLFLTLFHHVRSFLIGRMMVCEGRYKTSFWALPQHSPCPNLKWGKNE